MQNVRLPQYAWFDPREVEFGFPENWDVSVCHMAGYDRPALTDLEIKEAITNPIGMPPLRQLAKSRNEVAILFDDMTRTTPISRIGPPVLEELREAGIKDDQIRFICAIATHQPLDRHYLVKKVGEEIISRFPVYNHCPFMNCKDLGTTSYGTRVSLNAEVMACDLKIGIGQITPHGFYGWGGGSKIIMPGISSYESIIMHHGHTHKAWMTDKQQVGAALSGYLDNPHRDDAQEVAKMAGLEMKIDCMINHMGEPVGIYAGDPDSVFASAIDTAMEHYFVSMPTDSNIVVANAFIKAPEGVSVIRTAHQALAPEGGHIVILGSSPMGQIVHYLAHKWGKTIGGGLCETRSVPDNVKQVIIFTEYPEAIISSDFFNKKEKVLVLTKWEDVIRTLEPLYPGKAKVTVLPSADIQHSADPTATA